MESIPQLLYVSSSSPEFLTMASPSSDFNFNSMIGLCLSFYFFFFFTGVPVADCSTIGVEYISRLLEIQDRERAPPSVQIAAAYGTLNRLIPSQSSSFQFNIIPKVRINLSLSVNSRRIQISFLLNIILLKKERKT